MRKTQMALAAVALVASTAAMAADVTVSGRFDYAYASDNGTSPVTGLTAGSLAPNFFTVAGSEDLGGGLKASFNWQNMVTTAGALVNANANVGVSNEMGGIKLGRVTDSFAGGVLAFDVTGGANVGSAVSPIIQFGATGVFHSNAIQGNLNVAGLSLAGTYIGQDTAASRTAGAAVAADTNSGQAAIAEGTFYSPARSGQAGDYSLSGSTDLGVVKIGGAYASRSSTLATAAAASNTFTRTSHYMVGAGTTIGGLTANVNYMKLDTTTVLGLNGAYPLSDAVTVTAGYYDYANTTTSAYAGSLTSVGAKYAFSKATTGFANYETVTGGAKAMMGRPDGNAGTNRSIFMVGVGHSF